MFLNSDICTQPLKTHGPYGKAPHFLLHVGSLTMLMILERSMEAVAFLLGDRSKG